MPPFPTVGGGRIGPTWEKTGVGGFSRCTCAAFRERPRSFGGEVGGREMVRGLVREKGRTSAEPSRICNMQHDYA
jgi:hypothetical protein